MHSFALYFFVILKVIFLIKLKKLSKKIFPRRTNSKICVSVGVKIILKPYHEDWNFAFYLIVFVLVSTGVYYVINLIRTKFFPKSVSIQDYLSKKWRYWDGDEVSRAPPPGENCLTKNNGALRWNFNAVIELILFLKCIFKNKTLLN